MTRRYPAEQLRTFAEHVLLRLGADDEEAAILADCLYEGQLRAPIYSSQGFVRLTVYARRLRAGGLTARAPMKVVVDGPGTAIFDAGNGFGQVAACRAMRLAIDKAKTVGVGVVGVRNSGHFGQASYYSVMAAREGCIGIAITNASPEIPPWGGAEPLVGTNPWGIAAPSGEEPLVLDVSNAAAGRAAIRYLAARGEHLPAGWAFDAQGRPTQDIAVALDGLVAPMGGYKGVAIAVMMDVLAGVLTGARFGAAVGSPYQAAQGQGVGHLMIAIDIRRFGSPEEFRQRVDALTQEIHSGRRAPGVDRLYTPGEPECERRQDALAHGCVFLPQVEEALKALADELDVPFPNPLTSPST